MRTLPVRVSDQSWVLLRAYYGEPDAVVENLIIRQLEAHVASVAARVEQDRDRIIGYLPNPADHP